tara:strand:+ start:566 stop:988 length:423 start_codon:yes stop_codon:yes gene_type:complete
MAAVDLNTVRSTIEARLATELASSPAIPVVFSNMTFDSTTEDTFVQCVTSFGANEYLTQGDSSSATNNIVGLILLNVFTEEGIGAGSNFTICKRLRDLYNRITVSNVIFDAPVGPEIFTSSPEGKFQTQLRITFNIYEGL